MCVKLIEMASIGAQYKWTEGKILHTASLWKYPTKRRIPRLLIEDRALEVGILMHIEEPWMIFEETKIPASEINKEDSERLRFYRNKFYLLPEKFEKVDTYEWLKTPGKKLLLWGEEGRYFIKKAQT